MEEIANIEKSGAIEGWGTISSLISKSAELAENMERDDIFNMLDAAFNEMEKETDPKELFLNAYQFAFRFYFRMKKLDPNMPLNRVTLEHRIEPRIGAVDCYVITNYDYKMFTWARKRGFSEQIDNLTIIIPLSELTPAEKNRFDKKMQDQ